jgi:hypothetical protein
MIMAWQIFSVNQKSSANFQFVLRLFQMTVFLGIIAGMIVAVAITSLTIGDVFASALSLIPTGWGLLSVSLLNFFPHAVVRIHLCTVVFVVLSSLGVTSFMIN